MNQKKGIIQFQKSRRWISLGGLFILFLLTEFFLWGFYLFQTHLWEESLSQNLRSAALLTSDRLSGFPEVFFEKSKTFDPVFFQSLVGSVRKAGLIDEAFLLTPDGEWVADLIGDASSKVFVSILAFDKEFISTAGTGITSVAEPYRTTGLYFQNAYSPVYSDSDQIVAILGVKARSSSIEWFQKGLMILIFLSGTILIVFTALGFAFWRLSGQMGVVLDKMAETEQLAALGRMSAAVAHEIRNPLGIMIQTNSLLRKRYDKEGKDDLFNYIPDEINRLNRLTQEFLDFAKGGNSNPEEIDFSLHLKDCIEKVRGEFAGIQFVDKIQDDIFLKIDKGQFTSVIVNLLLNAKDAMPEGGEIEITLSQKNEKVFLEIKDNGIGMDKEVLNTALDPFFTTKEKGAGLGLAIVNMIVQNHKGKLNLLSEPGQGCMVQIELFSGQRV